MTELLLRLGGCSARTFFRCVVFALACCASAFAQSAPVLLTEGTGATTRGVAYESVSRRSEPFQVTSHVAWGADARTRVMLFAMNLHLLPGEGASALTADAEDSAGRRYPLAVEYVGKPPYTEFYTPHFSYRDVPQEWLFAVVVRLNDEMTDALGDVLVRVSLHGESSNRVRIAIGQAGNPNQPPDDSAAMPAPASTPTPMPVLTPKPYGPNESSTADAVRLLEQASWGPTNAEVARVRSMGLRAYVNEQLDAPANNYADMTFPLDDQNQHCPAGTAQADCQRDNYSVYPLQKKFFSNALYGQGQLRHRAGFALHQVLVVSGRDINVPSWYTKYLQALDTNAFGNYRQMLRDITLNPSMGEYLDMRRSTRTNPNENFAREILQLFSVGVDELNLDGTPKLDAEGNRIPAYTQETVNEFTRVFTGWNLNPNIIGPGITNWRDPMIPRSGTNHDVGAKTLMRGVVLPANQTATKDLDDAIDNIFQHPNVGPFVGKQLIQHLVTSNPSPPYVERVARVFNNDCDALYAEGCASVRGNMKAVLRAILLDPEARGDVKSDPKYGKLREPVQFMSNVLRALDAKSFNKTTASDGVLASRTSGGDYTTLMDQPLFLPATVFSYYAPDYEVPGTKILGPSFNILSTSTTLRRANFINQMVYTGVAPTTPPNTNVPLGTSLDLAPLEALATADQTGAQLVDQLNSLLLHGTMSTQMRESIRATVTSSVPVTDANFARKRAQMAVYLVTTSPHYQVQR